AGRRGLIAGRARVLLGIGACRILVGKLRIILPRAIIALGLGRKPGHAEAAILFLRDGEEIGIGIPLLFAIGGGEPACRVVWRDIDEIAALLIAGEAGLGHHREIEILAELGRS